MSVQVHWLKGYNKTWRRNRKRSDNKKAREKKKCLFNIFEKIRVSYQSYGSVSKSICVFLFFWSIVTAVLPSMNHLQLAVAQFWQSQSLPWFSPTTMYQPEAMHRLKNIPKPGFVWKLKLIVAVVGICSKVVLEDVALKIFSAIFFLRIMLVGRGVPSDLMSVSWTWAAIFEAGRGVDEISSQLKSYN